ncbi:MAG: hypothetical protein Q8L51_00225, partial [Candidatus Amesbacteria bacterium]|nr:hypothetical protein [Candidatus Amesbacteria bacterium]
RELLAATGSAVNFAGKFVVVNHECGQGCQKHAVINTETKDIDFYGLQTSSRLKYRSDSRLLENIYAGVDRSIFYEFKNNQMNYLCETESK